MATAQDVILKKDNTTVLSKVLEISSTEIKYKKWNNQDGPTYSIGLSDVLSITYENGEVDKFKENSPKPSTQTNYPQPKPQFVGFMKGHWGYFSFNDGKALTDEQVRSIVDPQTYELYLKSKKESMAGAIIVGVAGLALEGSVLVFLLAPNARGVAWGLLGATAVLTPIGLALGIDSGNKFKSMAYDYNRKHGYYSLNISPSMMEFTTPQAANTYGLGLTLTMNF
jgi:hypothetical protein